MSRWKSYFTVLYSTVRYDGVSVQCNSETVSDRFCACYSKKDREKRRYGEGFRVKKPACPESARGIALIHVAVITVLYLPSVGCFILRNFLLLQRVNENRAGHGDDCIHAVHRQCLEILRKSPSTLHSCPTNYDKNSEVLCRILEQHKYSAVQ